MLFHVWRASGADPYRTYNGLDEHYRPLHDPAAAPRPPQFPERCRMFLYACGSYARELEMQRDQAMVKGIARAVGGR